MHFLQECPICGCPLRITRDCEGRPVSCPHCRGSFLAAGIAEDGPCPADTVLCRTDELLQMASRRLATAAHASHSRPAYACR
jgi:hypothetical protein